MRTYANKLIPGDVFHPSEIVKDEFWIRLQKQYEMNKALIELQKAKMAS